MCSACIFNIQKFSLHDGPGIRTTVFFKGCPMTCLWCANPESLRPGPQVMWDERKCVLCGVCAGSCPRQALGVSAVSVTVDHGRCTGCGTCVKDCPKAALSLSGREYTLDEVVAVCLADKEFYEESGGGVTLSGGEVTAQAHFAEALLDRLHKEGIHVVLETNGFAPERTFARLAAKADLLLFDIKHYDDERHRDGTGVSNVLVLRNLRHALASTTPVLPRIPLIPDYNASPEDAREYSALLSSLGIGTVNLLPFHQLGQNKYPMLSLPYSLAALRPLSPDALAVFKDNLLPVVGICPGE